MISNRILLLTLGLAFFVPWSVPGAEPEILLWPSGAPGSEGKDKVELVEKNANGESRVSQIHKPSITPYLPAKDVATGAAVIVMPGGGHRYLAIDHEGYHVAKWLSERGIAAFVLKYRLARETNSTYKIDLHALADGQRAIRLVRSRAQEWGINPSRIGALGFSAGGEVVALTGMRFSESPPTGDEIDKLSARPDFQALIYPGSSGQVNPAKDSPPAFLACAYNDRNDISEGLANVYLRFKKVGVPAELHVYSTGGHGFGLRANPKASAGTWAERFSAWLNDNGFLKK